MKTMRLLLMLGLFLQVAVVLAQSNPAQPVRVLIPFSAGGSTDLFARNLTDKLQKYLPGVRLVAENRVGASGTLAASEVARTWPLARVTAIAQRERSWLARHE